MRRLIEVARYSRTDKADWGPGPWQGEPDKVQYRDSKTGLPCLVVRGPSGALCGYVGVSDGHPLFGREYNSPACERAGAACADRVADGWCCCPSPEVEAHGGLTFSAFCAEGGEPGVGICHVPEPGQPERVWWFGFDCAHYMDVTPASDARSRQIGIDPVRFGGETYKALSYVESEIEQLADQLAAAGARS